MKTQFHRFATVAGLGAMLAGALLAQPPQGSRAEIPFDFKIQDHSMPAGTYAISASSVRDLYDVRNLETGEGAFLNAPVGMQGNNWESKLVFRRYGDSYFLGEIWMGDSNIGHRSAPGRAEKDLIGKSAKATPVLASIHLK